MELKRYEKNPVLKPNPANGWESLAVLNPGAWYEDGQVKLLYRAAGHDKEHIIRFGLAVSRNGYDFERVSDKPVLSPSIDGFDAGCIEDPRIVKMGDCYYITYATRPFPPGQYWILEGGYTPELPDSFPPYLKHNLATSGLVLTKDFKTFYRAGMMTSPDTDNRDVILFPEKIKDRFVMLHRPLDHTGRKFRTEVPSIWMSFSRNLRDWEDECLLAVPESDWEAKKIGGSTPPLRTDEGWLVLYHGVDDKSIYRVGALLLDLDKPRKIIRRSRTFILEPKEPYETQGFYSGCVFPTGNVVIGNTLFVYYGGADKFCCVATCGLKDIVQWLIKDNKRRFLRFSRRMSPRIRSGPGQTAGTCPEK